MIHAHAVVVRNTNNVTVLTANGHYNVKEVS